LNGPPARIGLIALALLMVVVVSACGGGSGNSAVHASGKVNGHAVTGLYGSLPTAGTPTGRGTITFGQISGQTPTYLFPIIPEANATDGTQFLVDQLYEPLYNLQVGGVLKVNYATSAALAPTFSDGDKRVTIRLRSGLRWSNGQPVTSTDVLFDIALLKAAVKESAANWDLYTPGLLPDNIVSATAPDASTVVLTFAKAYNPAYILGNELAGSLTPLPANEWDVDATGSHVNWRQPTAAKKIYNYLAKAGASPATFASNSLWKTVDGPFTLASFSTTNASFVLDANPRYALTGPVRFSTLKVETYTSVSSQLDALDAGSLDVAAIDFSQLGQVGELRNAGYRVYGYPNIGSFGAIFNFKDKTGHFNSIISQLYVRQALAHLEDQPAYISGILKGAASAAYGPLPSVPKTPYTPADASQAPYPYSPSAAASLLRAHGWKVVANGQTTCAKAGTASDECGAGIPAGTPLKFNWFAVPQSETPSISLESDAFASAAKSVGIDISLGVKTFNYQTQNFNDADPGDSGNTNKWAVSNWGEYGTYPYPTQQPTFSSDGVSNFGGYRSPTADKLINQAIYGKSASAATSAASYMGKNVPMLFLPCADVLDAVSNKVGGTTDSWLAMTQDVFYPQYWYLKN
jgi:peptide/nickel transport system substrate-binding protein